MAKPRPVWQTRLEQLVRQLHWTTSEFHTEYLATARRLADAGQSRLVNVSQRQCERWLASELDGLPHPCARRVLEQLFGEPVRDLFGPPKSVPGPTVPARRQDPIPAATAATPLDIEREIAMAAAESARFGQFAEHNNVGPHTIEQFRDDITRIVTNYGNRPVYPTFIETRELRNRAFELLEGHQRPDQTRDLYLVAGLLCAILGEASHDLGMIPAAKTQHRTALLCAELAGLNWLRAWVRGKQSVVAYWDNQLRVAAELAADGWQYVPETGAARVMLASQEARARAKLRDPRAAEDALARAEQARESVSGEDEPGGPLAFTLAGQLRMAATTRLLIGGQSDIAEAERLAGQALELHEAEPPERRELGWICLARLDLAAAQLGRDDLEGAVTTVDGVLAIATQRPSETVTRRLKQIASAVERPRYQTTTLALDLRDQIRTLITTPTAPALPTGNDI